MIDAEADQRIYNEPFLFNRLLARLAYAEGAFFHALQGGIHL